MQPGTLPSWSSRAESFGNLSLTRRDQGADRAGGPLQQLPKCGEEFRWPVTPTRGLAHFHCRTATSESCCQPFPAFASRSPCPSCPTLGHPRPKPLTTLSLTAARLTLVKALRTENGRANVGALDLSHCRCFWSQAWWLGCDLRRTKTGEPGDQGKSGNTVSNQRTLSESVSCPVQPSTKAHIRTSLDSLLIG